MLSKVESSTIFWVFGMTWLGIEPRSPRPWGWAEKFICWYFYCWWHFWLMRSKQFNSNGRSVWTTSVFLLKNNHIVTFHYSILVSLYIYIYIYIYIYTYRGGWLVGCVLCYINICSLFNAKSYWYMCIEYVWFLNKEFCK